jgi:hypothetical protein
MLEDPMDLRHVSTRNQLIVVRMVVLTTVMLTAGTAFGQVRGKKPDRGTYQSPRLEPVDVEPITQTREQPEARLSAPQIVKPRPQIAGIPAPPADDTNVRQAAAWSDETVIWDEAPILHDETCDGCAECDAGCDSYGCDSIGPYGGVGKHSWANSFLSLDRSRWFGSIELLLMFSKGDRLPPLVTTGPEDDPNTAGQLDQNDTDILYGDERVLNTIRAGGRLTLGTWIDQSCCRSLVLRGWYGGHDTDSFSADQSQQSVITRPFFNVSDGQVPPEQDTQIVAFPDRATGSISVRASSEVFGADISARQKWFGRFGGTVDVLYGYQFMRFNEDLSISSTSVSQDPDFAPVGSVLAIDDRFDAENEFHGGQLGIASRYREGCWSFHSLAKVAFGSLRRGVALSGRTFTSIDGDNAVDPNGLLVRSTNARVEDDHTFGWVPELDLSLGWHQYPRFDVTFGYNIIAMTDAIQVSGLIDSDLAVNLTEPPDGQQRPSRRAHYRTYYTQGIHFGLQYVY